VSKLILNFAKSSFASQLLSKLGFGESLIDDEAELLEFFIHGFLLKAVSFSLWLLMDRGQRLASRERSVTGTCITLWIGGSTPGKYL
jgi:hypothetical protein